MKQKQYVLCFYPYCISTNSIMRTQCKQIYLSKQQRSLYPPTFSTVHVVCSTRGWCDSVVNTQKLSLEINAKNTYINSNVVLATNLSVWPIFLARNFREGIGISVILIQLPMYVKCKVTSDRSYLRNLQIVSYAKVCVYAIDFFCKAFL